MVIHIYEMDEPLIQSIQSQARPLRSNQMNQMNQTTVNANVLPPEFLMPVPFCEFVCDQLCWAFCECGICLCCIV